MNITQLIKAEGPISRAALAKKLSISEREVRALIAAENGNGVPIVFTGEGFVYARTRGQVNQWAANQMAAARSIIKKVAAVTKADVEGVAKGLFT